MMTQIVLAGLLFVGAHIGISSTGARARLVGLLGVRGYLGFYSLCAIATLGYLIWLYGELPRYEYIWEPSPLLYGIARYVMPVAFILLLGGLLVKNPTAVGMEGMLRDAPGVKDLARGVTRITRHPLQWAIAVWACSHLIANGDTISVVFFSTFLVLSVIGTLLIDRKKSASLGEHWRAYRDQTSNIPFLAIVTGRNRLAFAELWLPVSLGLGGYFAVLYFHEWIAGVRLI
jgi:uncharacterized membrane protein